MNDLARDLYLSGPGARALGGDRLLTTSEVARMFRVARSTVTSWAYRGLLPYTTTPTGHLRFYQASIERRLAERSGPES